MIEELMDCLWVFLGATSFEIIFNIRGKNLMFASFIKLLQIIPQLQILQDFAVYRHHYLFHKLYITFFNFSTLSFNNLAA